MTVLFHAVMALLDALALLFLSRRPGLGRCLFGLLVIVLGLWALSTLLGRWYSGSLFAFLRFMSTGVVLHLPIFLAGAGWIFLKERHRRTGWAAGLGALLIAAAGINAFWIEPWRLEVSRHTIRSAKVEKPFRIMVLADYQTDALGDYERRVWDTALAQNADLILLPGDYLQVHQDPERRHLMERTREYLRQIRFGESARFGAFAIDGDIEAHQADWAELFDGVPVKALEGTQRLELSELTLTALTLHDTRHNRDLKVSPSPRFHIAFGHAPDYALLGLDIDLQIAGHTHGGQLRVPGLGPLITFSRVPRAWAAGVTDLGEGRTLVVSRGIGMERGRAPRIRFLCRPEIVVLDVEPL